MAVTLTLVVGTCILCSTHLFVVLYYCVTVDKIHLSCFELLWKQFVTNFSPCDIHLGRGNLHFVCDTASHFALPFCAV